MQDTYNLQRFVEAQEGEIQQVRSELQAGRKRSHWMWFIFPQLRGLGFTERAEWFGIRTLAEAQAYLSHAVLGSRLNECTDLVNKVDGRSIEQIFGEGDAKKFRSSMTLFLLAKQDDKTFAKALKKYYGGKVDKRTLEILDLS